MFLQESDMAAKIQKVVVSSHFPVSNPIFLLLCFSSSLNMFPILLWLFILAGSTLATSLANLINHIGVHEIANISMLTTKLLFEYPMIRVANDKSVITSQYLLDLVGNPNADTLYALDSRNKVKDPRMNMFVQTNVGDCKTQIVESEWKPIDGCIDNSLADTVTTITRTGTVKLSDSLGPRIHFLLLGSRATLSFTGTYSHSVAEKISCDIQPGQTLQLHHKITTMRVENLRQRDLKVELSWMMRRTIKFAEWKDVDPENTAFQLSELLTCVTDPMLLKCGVD